MEHTVVVSAVGIRHADDVLSGELPETVLAGVNLFADFSFGKRLEMRMGHGVTGDFVVFVDFGDVRTVVVVNGDCGFLEGRHS